MRRAQQTAERAGLTGETEPGIVEWDYGAYEGRSTAEIRAEGGDPSWTIWEALIPPGETPGERVSDVGVRAVRALQRLPPIVAAGGACALVAHGHFLRILSARWLGLPAIESRLFALDPGTVSGLGFEHQTHVIRSWNASGSGGQSHPDAGRWR